MAKVVEIGGGGTDESACVSTHTVGGSRGMLLQKNFLRIRCSEIASDAIFVSECH